ncbi:MAG: VWA domain-containing protein [Pirellulaceae bacterium]
MQLSCVHCGQPFTITTEQLGGRGRCPHCGREIRLPEADDGSEATTPAPRSEPSHWIENSISGLTSLLIHMVLMLVLALISFGAYSGAGSGEDVLIGELPSLQLNDGQDEELSFEQAAPSQMSEEEFEEDLDLDPPVDMSPETTTEESFAVVSPSVSGGSTSSFDLGPVGIGGSGSMAGGSWEGLLQNLRRNGLDIVICFDSTGSMGGEIREVKAQIQRIGESLVRLVPKARISLCTYRDEGDAYVVRGLPLTGEVQEIGNYLLGVDADGGGDRPEAVHRGMRWAVENNRFRSNSRKVILIFGDAPPHRQYLEECLSIASDFARQQKGTVSTVTCRSGVRLPEFVEIAQMGGGEAFLTADERQIMTQLMVLVFGSRYRGKVLEAFRLLER